MLNSLDIMMVVFMMVSVASLLSLGLMFLVRSSQIKKMCFYIVAALGIYIGSVGVRIGKFVFPVQSAVGVIVAVVSIAAIVLAVTRKDEEKKFQMAQLMAAGALMAGFINAFLM